MRPFKKPALPGAELFERQPGGLDPAEKAEIGHRVATLLVRGPASKDDEELVERVVTVADDLGLDLIADLWSTAASDSLAGALWRLYALRTWVHWHPEDAAREFEAGRRFAPVSEVIAGVPDPPGPQEAAHLVDTVLRGVVTKNLDIALDRAAAFAHLVGIGRASLDETRADEAARLVDTARALHAAAESERAGHLT